MRFAVATVALFAASASAFNLVGRQSIPACAGTCISNANLGDCQATDNACLCKSSAFVSSTYSCIQSTCQGEDLTTAVAAAEALCAAVGVTLSSLPTGSAASSAAATGSGSASAPAASATKPASSSAASKSAAASGAGSTASSTGSAAPASSSKSAGSIAGVSSFVGLAAFGLAALTL